MAFRKGRPKAYIYIWLFIKECIIIEPPGLGLAWVWDGWLPIYPEAATLLSSTN